MEEAMLHSCSHAKWQQRQQIINNLLPKFLNNLESFSHSASARQGQLLLLLTCQHVAQLLATIENMLHKKRKTKSRSQCQLWKMTRQLFQASFLGVSCTQTIILTLMRFVTPSIVFTVVVVAALNFKISWYFELTQLLFLLLLFLDCHETVRSKRAKRPRAPEPVNFEPEPQQDLENEDNDGSQEKDIPEIPDNFLSPSVREYLELGKSIPGKSITVTVTVDDSST